MANYIWKQCTMVHQQGVINQQVSNPSAFIELGTLMIVIVNIIFWRGTEFD